MMRWMVSGSQKEWNLELNQRHEVASYSKMSSILDSIVEGIAVSIPRSVLGRNLVNAVAARLFKPKYSLNLRLWSSRIHSMWSTFA